MKVNEKKELSQEELEQLADETKREFIKKFGKYAVSAPSGMFLLMSLGTSKAHASSDLEDSASAVSGSVETSLGSSISSALDIF